MKNLVAHIQGFVLSIGVVAMPASALHAEVVLTSDAFGLYKPENSNSTRPLWSGLQIDILSDGTANERLTSANEIETILFFLGEKSLVAGSGLGHAVAIGLDNLGNLIDDGSNLTFIIENHDDQIMSTIDGIADYRFIAGTKAGTFFAGVGSEALQSQRTEHRIVSDLRSVVLEIAPNSSDKFDPEYISTIETSQLVDRFGNIVEDGVGVTFRIQHSDQSFTYIWSTVVNGTARANLITRNTETDGDIVTVLLGNTSAPVDFTIDKYTFASPVIAEAMLIPEIDATQLKIGPFNSSNGFLLVDGADVQLSATSANGRTIEQSGWVTGGYFETKILFGAEDFPLQVVVSSSLGTKELTIKEAETMTEVMEFNKP